MHRIKERTKGFDIWCKAQKNLYLQRLRSWPATREAERKSSFESILVFLGQWLEKLVFVGQWLEMLESW